MADSDICTMDSNKVSQSQETIDMGMIKPKKRKNYLLICSNAISRALENFYYQ